MSLMRLLCGDTGETGDIGDMDDTGTSGRGRLVSGDPGLALSRSLVMEVSEGYWGSQSRL